MIRLQIQVTEEQARRLQAVARKSGLSKAELVRRAVDRASDQQLVTDPAELRLRALAVVGQYADTVSDVSEHHDRYYADTI